jgi:predicted N-acetyltransferase YhbS
MVEIVPLSRAAPDQIEALLDAAFGLDRKARTAYKLRKGVEAAADISFAAVDNLRLIGTLQSWPVALEGDDETLTPLTLVGPVAVAPDMQRGGIGRLLMERLIDTAAATGHDALIMIGDPEYYGRFFGFTAEATLHWELPGPFERHRLLARVSRPGGVPARGRIIPDPAFATARVTA